MWKKNINIYMYRETEDWERVGHREREEERERGRGIEREK